jgi:hypothetical protein
VNEVFIVFRSEWESSNVVGVTDDEHLARKLARRTMMPGADHWLPRTAWTGSQVAIWENPAKHEYVYIERHAVQSAHVVGEGA